MKKFLSLALALIMTLSLVTISAGATEYKDFTDKDEIQYEEAVAVLNKLGIITGYSEGDFRPEGELTRGAAAKIIVSLLIGPENAEALPTTGNPYPDVPAGNVFAGYIGFCKTSGIISGYGDGTFRPNGTLTGYAFSKMLLGALGYKDQFEGLSGDGWTMNVANLANKAGLFNRIDFKGGDTVNRETACLLALNTLKATMVEYSGGMNITTDAGSMVVNPTRTYVISNQDYATHISNRKAGNGDSVGNAGSSNTHYTVEFGEEHFRDLRMDRERSNKDDFGRPSNVWSYKKVTIGTYPVEADYTYTTQVIHNVDGTTDASKVRALELSGFTTKKDGLVSQLTINGKDMGTVDKVADIANYTDNGALVEVYISDEESDFITDVVVIQTQLMEVKRVGSDYVSLDKSDVDGKVYGYNYDPIDVNVHDVEVDDDYYSVLKELKAGDLVAIVPVTTDEGQSYDVAEAYVPETATGSMTRVETYGTAKEGRKAIKVTVGGTVYNIAQWNCDLTGIDGDTIRVTNKDVTLVLDKYGNALKAKDVGDTSNWMIIKNYRQGLVNGSIVTYANGWDISGEELSLNVGSGSEATRYQRDYLPGDLVHYTNNINSNTAEWKLTMGEAENVLKDGVFQVAYDTTMADGKDYNIKASNTSIRLDGYGAVIGTTSDLATIDTGIKFIYVNIDSTDREVDSIEFVNGVKDATNDELQGVNANTAHGIAQACVSLKDLKASDGTVSAKDVVTADSAVKAVVIKQESTDASVGNLLYISNYHGSATLYDGDNRPVYGYEAVIMGTNGKIADDDAVIYSYRNLKIGQFARYTKVDAPAGVDGVNDNFYELRGYGAGDTATDDASTTWGRSAAVARMILKECLANDKYLVRTTGNYTNSNILARAGMSEPNIAKTFDKVDQYILGIGDSKADDLLNFRGADWVDLRQNVTRIEDIDDLKAVINADKNPQNVEVSLLFNDNPDSDDFRKVYLVVVTDVVGKGDDSSTPTPGGETKYIVTLTGALAVDSIVTADGKQVEPKETRTTFDGIEVDYEIAENASVLINNANITGGIPTDAVYGKTAVKLNTTSNMMAFTVIESVTLYVPTMADELHTITFEDGVTPKEDSFYSYVDGARKQVTPANIDGNVYYFKKSDNVQWLSVKTTNGQSAIALKAGEVARSAGYGVAHGTKDDFHEMELPTSENMVGGENVFVCEAVKVNNEVTTGTVKLGGVTVSGNTSAYVKYGTDVTVTITGGAPAIIAGGESTTYGTDIVDSGLNVTKEVNLYPAYKLTTNVETQLFVNSTTTSGPEMPAGEYYVVSGTYYQVCTSHDSTDGVVYNRTSRKSVTTTTTVYGAAEITVATNTTITTKDSNGNDIKVHLSGGKAYILPETVINVATTDSQLLVEGDGIDDGSTAVNVNDTTGKIPSWIKAGSAQSAEVIVPETALTFTES